MSKLLIALTLIMSSCSFGAQIREFAADNRLEKLSSDDFISAVRNGQTATVSKYIEAGGNVDARDADDYSAVSIAAHKYKFTRGKAREKYLAIIKLISDAQKAYAKRKSA